MRACVWPVCPRGDVADGWSKPEVIQLERHFRSQEQTSSGRPGLSASAYSTHPARLVFGVGFATIDPGRGGGGQPLKDGSLLHIERSRSARNGPTALS